MKQILVQPYQFQMPGNAHTEALIGTCLVDLQLVPMLCLWYANRMNFTDTNTPSVMETKVLTDLIDARKGFVYKNSSCFT